MNIVNLENLERLRGCRESIAVILSSENIHLLQGVDSSCHRVRHGANNFVCAPCPNIASVYATVTDERERDREA